MTPRYHTHTDTAHLARIIAARRRLCVGEGFEIIAPTAPKSTPRRTA